MATSRSSVLDALRGVAALGVFAFHAWLYTLPLPDAGARDSPGEFVVHELRLGLVLFFVLSGFLLFGPWAAGQAPRLGSYLRRRAARILPAYYLALLGSIALLWPLAGTPGVRLPPAEALPLFAIFAQNTSIETVMRLDPPMWTLAIEVWFYLLLPLLGWLALRCGASWRARAAVPLALVAIGLAYNFWLAIERPGLTYSKSLLAMLPYFGVGMLTAVVLHVRRPRRRAALTVAALALVVADATWHGVTAATGASTFVTVTFRDLPAAVGFALLIAAVSGTEQRRAPGPVRLFAGLGIVSYGFYLWHVPVLLVLRGHSLVALDPFAAGAVAGAVSLVLAVLSWKLVERPAIAWGRRTRDVSAVSGMGRQPV